MRYYTIGRVLALLSGIWSAYHLVLASMQSNSIGTWASIASAVGWVAVALWLWLGRRVFAAASTVLALGALDLFIFDLWSEYGVLLLIWLALILLVAPHSRDQLLLARVLTSTVYAFSALSKLQPSWLAGDNLFFLVNTRPQAVLVEPFLVQPWLSAMAAAVCALELWLAIGLWFPSTRLLTAMAGVSLHVSLVFLAAVGGALGVLMLLALNGALVLMYPAFWRSLRHQDPGASPPEKSGYSTVV